jgi:predicted YcjX-like family ATPase
LQPQWHHLCGLEKGCFKIVRVTDILDNTRIAAGGLADFATGLVSPSLRLGVTGLSRAGKTVFITALVNALLKGGRFPRLRGAERRAHHTLLPRAPAR